MTQTVASPRAPQEYADVPVPVAGLSLRELAVLVREYADHPERWRPVLRYPAPGEDRWWTRLPSAEGVDVWLLSWLPGHTTELHDHGPSGAAFTVVEGALTEVRVSPGGQRGTYARPAGATTTVPVGEIHDVIADLDPAVSIHAYSPPLEQMTYYAETGGRIAQVETVVTDDPEQGPRR